MPPQYGARYGLVGKFVILATAVILATTFVGNRLILAYEEERLLAETRGEALVLAESMALSFLHTLVYEELGLVVEGGLLDLFIEDISARPDMAVRFVEVVDDTGRVIAHSDYRRYGQQDLSVAERYGSPLRHTRTGQRDLEGETVLEVATPLAIGTRSWGTLVLAVSLQSARADLESFASRLEMMTLAAAILCIFVSLLVARALARPVKNLAQAMTEVGPDLETSQDVTRRDEIGLLQTSFLGMLGRLREARQEQERTREAMVRAERLAAIGALASGVAHEVNNPLAGVKNCLAQMAARPEDRQRHREYMGLMATALDRIEQVTRGLLDFSRRQDLEIGPVALSEIISHALDLVSYQLEENGIELIVEGAEAVPIIMGDRHQLEQVFVNLVLNAIDSMSGGGTLTIRARQCGDEARIDVEDTGGGVPHELWERVFDPFFTTKGMGRGTGLGLTVSLNIVREHGGELRCGNTPQGGGRFTVALPIGAALPRTKAERTS